MCTAATYRTKNTYFGRNLDYEFSYGESITIVPRKFPLQFRESSLLDQHYAMLGIAFVTPDQNGQNYPLFYDGINEKGLGIAGLNFVGNAVYNDHVDGKDNIAQFELVPWLLAQCATVQEARTLLDRINITNTAFSTQLPPSQLHWMISDSQESIVVESVADGLKIYDNPVGILTNNPPFPEQVFNLNNYMQLSAQDPVNNFAPELNLQPYSRGMGAIGLPGDTSSASRFVRAAFTKFHSMSSDDEMSSISQFFHILSAVDQPRGSSNVGDDKFEITIYSSGYNLNQGLCYYNSYNNHQITVIDMHKTDLDANAFINYPMILTEQIQAQN